MAKGFIADGIVGMVLLFVISVTVLIAYTIYSSVNSSGIFTGQAATNFAATGTTVGLFDEFFLLFLAAVAIGGIVSAFLVESHPVFFLAMVLMNLVSAFMAATFGNAYASIAVNSTLSAAANQYPLMLNSYAVFPAITVVIMFLMAAAMYAKGGRI